MNFNHQHSGFVEIICNESMLHFVNLNTRAIYPSKSFLDFAAKVGAAETGQTAGAIRKGLVRCHQGALKQDLGVSDAEVALKDAKIECSIYRQAGDDLSVFTISSSGPSKN